MANQITRVSFPVLVMAIVCGISLGWFAGTVVPASADYEGFLTIWNWRQEQIYFQIQIQLDLITSIC